MIGIEAYSERLLSWLGSLSLQAALLVGLALALAFAVRRASPRLSHLVWLVVLLRLAIPIELSTPLGLLREPPPPAPTRLELAMVQGGLDPVATRESVARTSVKARVEAPVRTGTDGPGRASLLVAAWLTGVTALLGIVLLRWRRVRGLLASASAADASLHEEVVALSRRLGVAPPRVRIAGSGIRLPSPAAFGLRRPTILLPESIAGRWTAPEREPLLVHELAHLRRRDLWINALQLIVQTLYFFHPLVWIANRSLRVARELACDEEVARFYGAASKRYPRALLRAARGEEASHSSVLAVALATPRSLLGRRVQSLLSRRATDPRRQWARLAAVLVGSLSIVALAAARPAEPSQELEIPTDSREWLAFVQEVKADPERREATEAALIDRVRSGAGDPELLERTLQIVRPHRPPLLGGDRELEAAWSERLEALPADLPTLRAAASFFVLQDRERARVLLRKGWELEPGSAHWPLELARLEYLDRMQLSGSERRQAAERALGLLIEASPLLDGEQLYSQLGFFARVAYGAGDLSRAREFSRLLLQSADERGKGWNYGNALHHGHTVLGLVALAEGDRDEAVRRLLLSADTPGSPQLNSFGPSFKLAADLLELGERDAVLEYLERCGDFWTSPTRGLDAYIAAVSAGKTPAFRELHY